MLSRRLSTSDRQLGGNSHLTYLTRGQEHVRKALLTAAAAAGLVGAMLVPAAPALAAETCNGLPVTITDSPGGHIIMGTPGDDVISAGDGNDIVLGLDGNDTVCLGPGDDLFDGGLGADTMVADAVPDGRDAFSGGGPGIGGVDTVTYAARTTPVNVSLDGVDNDGAPGEGDSIGTDVQAVVGGSAADVITSSAVTGQTYLTGGAGDDTLSGTFDLFGDSGNDSLVLTSTGSGTLIGGDGDDTLTGGPVRDDLSGGNGADTLIGGGGDDELFGGPGNDALRGLDGNDDLFGEEGNDSLIGGLGTDSLIGGDGDDTASSLVAADGADGFFGGAGTDTADYSARQGPATLLLSLDGVANDGQSGEGDNIGTDVENINGGVSPNIIVGNGGPNVLRGGQGNDSIQGTDGISGNDTVIGGFGFDACTADPGDKKDCEA